MAANIKKPEVQLSGQDGNVFNLVGIASRALKRAGQAEAAKQMAERVFDSGSYDQALGIISEYVEVS